MKTKKLVFGALLIAIGVLLPQVFHIIGGKAAGGVFLPMHIPVIFGGFLLGPLYGLALGFLTPIISFFATGMPPVPIVFFMTFELATYGLLVGLAYKKLTIYPSLIISLVGGRVVNIICMFVGSGVFGLKLSPLTAAATSVVTGIPGIIVQLTVIPLLIIALKKGGVLTEHYQQ